jgi:osmotically-inducible protein OsmY
MSGRATATIQSGSTILILIGDLLGRAPPDAARVTGCSNKHAARRGARLALADDGTAAALRGRMVVRRAAFSALAVTAALALTACARPEGELQRRIEDRLRAEHVASEIDVSVDRRVVTLRGAVDSEGERTHVEDVVRSVEGVLAVDDRLLVRQPPFLTAATPDAEEAAAVTSALASAGFLGLRVEVTNGTLHLRGKVPTARHDDAVRTVQRAAPKAKIVDETTRE